MAVKYDNCKDCNSRCVHAGKDREFICVNGVSCKITKERPQTNADRLRSMSDEELARALYDGFEPEYCKNDSVCGSLLSTDQGIPEEKCIGCLLEWLKQPAEE